MLKRLSFFLALAAAVPAQSTVIIRTYDIIEYFGFGNVSQITGSFTLTYDDAVDVSNDTANIITNALSFSVPTVGFSYAASTKYLSIGGVSTLTGASGANVTEKDFSISFTDVGTSTPTFYGGGITYGPPDNFSTYATGATITASTPTAAVPEPATWAMMIGGFGLVGAAMRRRRVLVAV